MSTVVLVSSGLGPGSGTAGVAHAVARGLVARGYSVDVCCRRARHVPDGVGVRAWSSRHRRQVGELWLGFDRVAGCDAVRASGGAHEAWLHMARRQTGRWWQPWRPRERAEAARERRALRDARLVACNSWRAAGDLQAWHGLTADRLRVVRNGVDLQRFRPDAGIRMQARRRWSATGRVALFVAQGWFRKGFAAAVRAFAAVADRRDRLVVVGRDARQGAHLRAARAQIGDRLVVLGQGDPARWLPAADALVHPTRYDASANVVLEAMACGVPPVTTLRDGAAETVPDRSLVVGDPDDVEGIAGAVRYAWETSALRAACREAAERWPTSRMVSGFENLLQELQDG